MSLASFQKTILVKIDQKSWPNPQKIPPAFIVGSTQPIDLGKALLMLGTLTMPNALSPASPARYWTWLRYFHAIAPSRDLRITTSFADLDPHQKSILSDDFGVAISTQWLFDRLGGFSEVVDGRRFMSQFSSLVRRPRPSTPRVGPNKSPDFVIKDTHGKWHVIECKGTQSGRGARNQFIKRAIEQKQVIQIKDPTLRGEALATGVSISNEHDDVQTQLLVKDPISVDPEIIIKAGDKDAIELSARRLSVAQAFTLLGLDGLSAELALPEDAAFSEGFLTRSEVSHLKRNRKERHKQAILELQSKSFKKSQHQGHRYSCRTIELPIAEWASRQGMPFNQARIRYGIETDFIDLVQSSHSTDEIGKLAEPYIKNQQIRFGIHGNGLSLSCGDILFCEIVFSRV